MARDLQLVSSSLAQLPHFLTHDLDIQSNINGIVANGRAIAAKFTKAVANEGHELFRQKANISYAVTITGVIVKDLHMAVVAARDACAQSKNGITNLQTNIHSAIEIYRGRKAQHDKGIAVKQASMTSINGQIADTDVNIRTLDNDVAELEAASIHLDNHANDIRRKAKRRKRRGLFGGIIGFALAPFTGGASLALGTVYAGVNMNSADDCNGRAWKSRDEATRKRTQAQTLRGQRQTLANQKATLETEIQDINTKTGELERAASSLASVTTSLLSAVPQLDAIIFALQDMDTALKAAEMETDSFKIIQASFSGNSSSITNTRSQRSLDGLKAKWNNLESVLIRHGATPIQNS